MVNSMLYSSAAVGDPSTSPSLYLNDNEIMCRSSLMPLSWPPSIIFIDSVQIMVCDAAGASSVGGIKQVRECVGLFLHLAKSMGIRIKLVGCSKGVYKTNQMLII